MAECGVSNVNKRRHDSSGTNIIPLFNLSFLKRAGSKKDAGLAGKESCNSIGFEQGFSFLGHEHGELSVTFHCFEVFGIFLLFSGDDKLDFGFGEVSNDTDRVAQSV